ncbi:MAG: glycosyl transferase [Geobacter sp.]|nr:MAG: glycosyl transferase [Geobacter sp.]
MNVSIITPSYNCVHTIASCLDSINCQSFSCEHIVIDGASSDGTAQFVRTASPQSRIISEPDNGIYDAMNKGIMVANGDIIGILNADDFYINEHVIAKVVNLFEQYPIDAVIADLVFVKPDNLDKIVRYYSSNGFTTDMFASGWMPPHPTFFVKRKCYEQFGLYKTDYQIAADFELLARFMVKYHVKYHYLPEVIIKMRTGGTSTKNWRSNFILNREVVRACMENDIKTNYFKVYSKYFRKVMQLVARPT